MKQAHPAPRARLVTKVPLIPVAQEPPVPVITASKKASKAKGTDQVDQQQKQQRRQALLPQAEELSQQNPGLNPQNAYEILLGHYSLDEWRARRQATQEKRRQHCQRRREARFSDKRSDQEKAWCFPLFEATEPEPIWMETVGGDQIARVTKAKTFLLAVQIPDGSYRGFPKTEISALCRAAHSPQVQPMRQVEAESKRNVLPALKRQERWSFPHQTFSGWVGRQVQIQLLNGSTWTGFLRWNSHYSFLLGAQPEGEPEVLLFKHACCGLQVLHQSS